MTTKFVNPIYYKPLPLAKHIQAQLSSNFKCLSFLIATMKFLNGMSSHILMALIITQNQLQVPF